MNSFNLYTGTDENINLNTNDWVILAYQSQVVSTISQKYRTWHKK